ncbi:hypothetical protein [Orenia marismortui]|uniref:Uncharacterized protein n=1 Tax=Orenia marismortui TaxID=46469 RepID=A0A4R8GRB4_9FIRM|nr:hypothetical protein [Orenia marismortui]TDX48393.1 hypothetical protein C7959_1281 [Orenia marismortui]
MNYILIIIIVLPILALVIWMDSINKKYEEEIKDVKRLIYKVHDEVSEIKRVEDKKNKKR